MPIDARTSSDVEGWFRRRGLVPLLRNTGVGAGASARATPFLVATYVLVMMTGIPLATGLTVVSGLALAMVVVGATWVLTNLLRRRPPFARPRRIGAIECLVFVLAPVVPVLLSPDFASLEEVTALSDEDRGAVRLIAIASTVGIQLLILAAVFVVVVLGLASVSRWLAREVFRALSSGASTLLTTLPVVMGVVFFFFLNPGVWVTVGRQSFWAYVGTITLLVLLAGAFLASRAQFDLAALARFEDTADLGAALQGTPLATHAVPLPRPTSCPLGGRERINLRLIAVLSRLVIALIIAGAVFCFFLVLGYLAVDAEAVRGWIRTDPTVLIHVTTSQHTYILSAEHARVAGFLATFAAFNYSLASATDARLRHDISEAAQDMAREACAMRLALLRIRDRDATSGRSAAEAAAAPAESPTTSAGDDLRRSPGGSTTDTTRPEAPLTRWTR